MYRVYLHSCIKYNQRTFLKWATKSFLSLYINLGNTLHSLVLVDSNFLTETDLNELSYATQLFDWIYFNKLG